MRRALIGVVVVVVVAVIALTLVLALVHHTGTTGPTPVGAASAR